MMNPSNNENCAVEALSSKQKKIIAGVIPIMVIIAIIVCVLVLYLLEVAKENSKVENNLDNAFEEENNMRNDTQIYDLSRVMTKRKNSFH